VFRQEGEERDGLDSLSLRQHCDVVAPSIYWAVWVVWVGMRNGTATDLSETHLVGEDTVDTLLIKVAEPSKTLELVLLELRHEHLRLGDGECILAE
jgi:hypothetical protein